MQAAGFFPGSISVFSDARSKAPAVDCIRQSRSEGRDGHSPKSLVGEWNGPINRRRCADVDFEGLVAFESLEASWSSPEDYAISKLPTGCTERYLSLMTEKDLNYSRRSLNLVVYLVLQTILNNILTPIVFLAIRCERGRTQGAGKLFSTVLRKRSRGSRGDHTCVTIEPAW